MVGNQQVVQAFGYQKEALIAKKTYTMFKKQSEARAQMTSLVDEMVGNQKVVQAFGYQKEALERFDAINQELKVCSLKAIFFSSITNPSTRFVNGLVYTGVGIVGAISAMQGLISVGQLSCFLSYANQYTKITNPSTRFVNGLVYTGVGIVGAISAMQGLISVGQLSCFLSYANQYTKPFNEISGVVTELQNAFACAKRVFDFIEEEPEMRFPVL